MGEEKAAGENGFLFFIFIGIDYNIELNTIYVNDHSSVQKKTACFCGFFSPIEKLICRKCAVVGYFKEPRYTHIPTMTVGVVWLFSIMAISLLLFPVVQYFYLFARYAGISSPIWIVNKIILLLLVLYFGLVFLCFAKSVYGSIPYCEVLSDER